MTTVSLNAFQRGYRRAIALSKVGGVVWLLQAVHDMKKYEQKQQRLKALPPGTVGRAVAEALERHDLRLIPRFENHDLKHILLGYDMSPEGEIKMQAFMLGNGNYSLTCILFLSFGILMPELWGELLEDFRKGRQTPSIAHVSLENCASGNLFEVKKALQLQ